MGKSNNDWQYSTIHKTPCKIIEEQSLWGQTTCRIWLPNSDAVVKIPKETLQPLSSKFQPEIESNRISYVAAAAKVAEILEGGKSSGDGPVLLAPMESSCIPLPHQITALSRAISNNRVRYLLADEVGLGKTIEAGLIIRELKLRGLVRRTLIIAPKGLTTQWVAEMQTHFNEIFQPVMPADLSTLERIIPREDIPFIMSNGGNSDHDSKNPWTMFEQIIVSLDSVKPLDKRRGWTEERVAEYNRSRFENLITAGWDLVIVDEAHRLGGSTDQVARYKLGQGLAEAAPYLLLLTATPHQGKTDAFHRLMTLLDEDGFPNESSISKERVAPYVIRTEKRNAIDAENKPLFKPRRTEIAPIRWEERHEKQQLLYEAVTDYVREGYNQALRDKKHHVGFLMILMQRLVVSSTRAIRTTLERRFEVLSSERDMRNNQLVDLNTETTSLDPETLYDMDGQELLEELLESHVEALENELSHVTTLLNTANECEQAGSDAKTETLIDLIYRLQTEENDPDLKILIFTEFIPTQAMLAKHLEDRGISTVILNGSLNMDERKQVQESFRDKTRVLISTDAGGEGLNLQFCHIIINYDIPWNPMRLEQRIGRVDRIGQVKIVRAFNFIFEESVEFRVREVLEQKLSVIFHELGFDKTGDVLDSAQAGELFENIFVDAIVNPESVFDSVDQAITSIRNEVHETRENSAVYGISDEPDVATAQQLRSHPLPHWLERMTCAYINAHGGLAEKKSSWWKLTWPNGEVANKQVFNARDAERLHGAQLLNLENNRIRGLALNLPQIAQGQPVPKILLKSLPGSLNGYWGLFEIRLQINLKQQSRLLRIPLFKRKFLSVFVSDQGKIFLPTARHIWDELHSSEPILLENAATVSPESIFDQLLETAHKTGEEVFNALRSEHLASVNKEEDRGNISFDARKKALERVGLPEVRNYRQTQIKEEESLWRNELLAARQIMPEIKPLLMLQITGGSGHG